MLYKIKQGKEGKTIEIARTQESNGTVSSSRRQHKNQESSSQGFYDLLNGMLAFNPIREIRTSRITSGPNGDAAAKSIERRPDGRSEGQSRVSGEKQQAAGAQPREKSAGVKNDTANAAKTTETKDDAKSAARSQEHTPLSNENAQGAGTKPGAAKTYQGSDGKAAVPDNNGRYSHASAVNTRKGSFTRPDIQGGYAEPKSSGTSRAAFQTAQQATNQSAAILPSGAKFSSVYTQGLGGRHGGVSVQAPNLLPNTDPRLAIDQAADKKLGGMIGRAARELDVAAAPHSENLIEPQMMKMAQPLSKLERGPVIEYVNRTETITTAVVEGMNKEESLIEDSFVKAPNQRNSPIAERSGTENETFKPAVRIKSEKPEAAVEAQTGGTQDVRRPFEPIGIQARDMSEHRPAQAPDQAQQIQTEVLRNLENQKMEFRMQLQPEELGKIDIKMALQDGKLMIEIISSAKTSELLSRQLESLTATLRQNSPDLTSVQVVNATHQTGEHLESGFNTNGFEKQGRQADDNSGSGSGQPSFGLAEDNPDDTSEAGPARLLNYAV